MPTGGYVAGHSAVYAEVCLAALQQQAAVLQLCCRLNTLLMFVVHMLTDKLDCICSTAPMQCNP